MRPPTGRFDIGGQRLVTPPIRGRAGELQVIGASVRALARGRGGVLVIEGPPGIGKSRLLTEVLALADKAGVRTLFGEAFEYQQAVPFFSLFMATLRADPPVGDADALRRLGGSADLSYWVVHDLADAIDAAAAQTPLAIVLEDIHWADNGTLLALRSLATARPGVAVLWVLTARTGAGGPAVQETLSVLQRADAAVVRVAAMSADAVAEMVSDAVRANADESLLNLAAKAHGNPFLVSELVGGLDEEGRLTVSGGCAVAAGRGLITTGPGRSGWASASAVLVRGYGFRAPTSLAWSRQPWLRGGFGGRHACRRRGGRSVLGSGPFGLTVQRSDLSDEKHWE